MEKNLDLPDLNDLTFAISDAPLGQGTEARVYKIHTKPQFTLRVSNEITNSQKLINIINNSTLVPQKNIFEERNFAQNVAIFKSSDDQPLVSINKYVPGISIDIDKLSTISNSANYKSLSKEEKDAEYANILGITQKLSETIANISDEKFDKLFDDLHFLSSIKQSIDCGNGLFTNIGNILYSGNDKQLNIIDIQPFIEQAPGINLNHTKGSNSPYNLLQGVLPGSYFYRNQDYIVENGGTPERGDHSKDKNLIALRTQIVEKIISAAERSKLSDLNDYSTTNIQSIHRKWDVQLDNLRIPEKYKNNFLFRVVKIKDEERYKPKQNSLISQYIRVGRGIND